VRKHELAGAVAKAGGASALARLLGVSPSTVRRWLLRGITPGGKKLLAILNERRKLMASEERTKRQTFDLLFKLAGERGELKRGRSREGTRAGPRTSGYQWVLAVNEMASIFTVEMIDAWMISHRRRFPFFQATAVTTEYTKQKFKGYKVVRKQVPDVEASGDFAIEEVIATSRSAKLSDVRAELTSKLEDALEEGALVYVHEVTLFNYRLRTEKERLAWEAGKRSSRKRRAKRRLTPEQKAKRAAKAAEKREASWKSKKTSKTSSKASKKSTRATQPKAKAPQKKTSATGASRARSASTRSQPTRLSSSQAKGKASARTTSGLRSLRTTSKKSSTKQKSSSPLQVKIPISTQTTQTTKTTKTTKTTRARKAMAKTTKTTKGKK